MINQILKKGKLTEKDIKLEKELYKKGNVFKLIDTPYFRLNCSGWLSKKEIKKLIDYANKDKEKGLKMIDYEDIFNILVDKDIFYKTLRDIFLIKRGIKIWKNT